MITSGETAPRPEVVTLCGSTRFFDAFRRESLRLTVEGNIVLSVCVGLTLQPGVMDGHTEMLASLHELHLRKIDISDHIMVLNVGGYIGLSTRGEIAYAVKRGVKVTYLVECWWCLDPAGGTALRMDEVVLPSCGGPECGVDYAPASRGGTGIDWISEGVQVERAGHRCQGYSCQCGVEYSNDRPTADHFQHIHSLVERAQR